MSGIHYIIKLSKARILENSEPVTQFILCHFFSSASDAARLLRAVPTAARKADVLLISLLIPKYYTIK